MSEGVAIATAPMECAVGCSTCANVCPTSAISFPKLDAVWKMERERQIFRIVKKEAQPSISSTSASRSPR